MRKGNKCKSEFFCVGRLNAVEKREETGSAVRCAWHMKSESASIIKRHQLLVKRYCRHTESVRSQNKKRCVAVQDEGSRSYRKWYPVQQLAAVIPLLNCRLFNRPVRNTHILQRCRRSAQDRVFAHCLTSHFHTSRTAK